MTNREGNLEAPIRYPVAWKTAEFYDRAACEKEMERVFDICHGCQIGRASCRERVYGLV